MDEEKIVKICGIADYLVQSWLNVRGPDDHNACEVQLSVGSFFYRIGDLREANGISKALSTSYTEKRR
jgi:hypothetical protein